MRKALSLSLVLAGALALSACARPGADAAVTGVHAVEGQETATGTFVGENGHVSGGTGSIFWDGQNWLIALGTDFELDGAPDPKVGLGTDGTYDTNSTIEELRSLTGQQVYVIPASLDVANYNQIYIWCEEFSVSLAVADLTLL